MVFIMSCIQPPEEVQTTPPVPNPRSEADGGARHPPILSFPRLQLLFQVLLMSHYACGCSARGLMWYGMSQIAVGGNCNQLGETVETLLYFRNTLLHWANVTRAIGASVRSILLGWTAGELFFWSPVSTLSAGQQCGSVPIPLTRQFLWQ